MPCVPERRRRPCAGDSRSFASSGGPRRAVGGCASFSGGSEPARRSVFGFPARGLPQPVRDRGVARGGKLRVRGLESAGSRGRSAMKTVFVDVDTQNDFLFPAGTLYV